ncbi:deoxyribodipyrimidine photo-lyase, partial [Streptomyces sp. SID5785]|uniref:deoxyribodipyrimidine photo-lyase n=1 Tax=Streptomyces sp. SID5785 TaxID=2690309 RepID=UPI0013612934|nr:deoxyribodipyrimidine photo-lyase [Streptomyces sp. SID5785]
MNVSVVLFTSDLRLHDHPPLRAALRGAGAIVPLFVRDPGVDAAGFAAPNRLAFLADCLAALDAGLRSRGGRLVLRRGDTAREVASVVRESGAGEVHLAAGHSAFARRREERLRTALEGTGCRIVVHDAVTTAVAPGRVTPAGKDHFAVFTPYFRHWRQEPLRDPLAAPRTVRVPDGVRSDPLPARADVHGVSPGLDEGGEPAGR